MCVYPKACQTKISVVVLLLAACVVMYSKKTTTLGQKVK